MVSSKNIIRRSKAKLTSFLKVAYVDTKTYVQDKLRRPPATVRRFALDPESSGSYADTISPVTSYLPSTNFDIRGSTSGIPRINHTEGSSIADNSTMDGPSPARTTRRFVIRNSSVFGNPQRVNDTGSSPAAATTRRVIVIGPSATTTSSGVSPVISSDLEAPNLTKSSRSLNLARRDAYRMWRMRMVRARNYQRHGTQSDSPAGPAAFPGHRARPSVPLDIEQHCFDSHQRPKYREMGTQTHTTTQEQSTQTTQEVEDQGIQTASAIEDQPTASVPLVQGKAQLIPSDLSSRHLSSGGSSAETPVVWGRPLPRKRGREFIKGYWRLEDPFVEPPPQTVFAPVVEKAPIPQQAPVSQAQVGKAAPAPALPQSVRLANLRSAIAPPAAQVDSSDTPPRRWSDFDSDEFSTPDNKRLVRVASNQWEVQPPKQTSAAPAQSNPGVRSAVPAEAHTDSHENGISSSDPHCSNDQSEKLVNSNNKHLVRIGSEQCDLRPEDSISQHEELLTLPKQPQGQLHKTPTLVTAAHDPLAPFGPVYITPNQILLTGEYKGEWDSQPRNRVDPLDLRLGGIPGLNDAVYAAAEEYDNLYRAHRALMHNNNVSTWKVTVLEGELLRRNRQVQEQEAEIRFLRIRLGQVERERGIVDDDTVVHKRVASEVDDEEDSELYQAAPAI